MTDMTNISAWASRGALHTDVPGRYGKQLASHMSRKVTTSWDEQTQRGSITFNDGVSATLAAAPATLDIELTAPTLEDLSRYEHVIGIHLVRFGHKDALVCDWERTSPEGETSTGSRQTVDDIQPRN